MALSPSERGVYAHSSPFEGRKPLVNELMSAAELQELKDSDVWRGIGVPKGDGSPVVVFPGLFGTDSYLVPLRSWLMRMNYDSRVSGMLNIIPEFQVGWVKQRIRSISEETGRRVHLIGHSLGGSMAKIAAREIPDYVESLILLATPRNGHGFFRDKEELLKPLHPKIKTINIYTRDDGVLSPEECRDPDPKKNVNVSGTHIGLVWSKEVYPILGQFLHYASSGRILDFNSSGKSRSLV